ncbi:3-oxoacyl-ACP reductase FabG [Buchananella hordeovulneris]|uniref:Beta-ketoacyl-ACP reductase n=1 Tax=Buchananella hordeovulneris TaxID=52770 RepID=A0A1Q5PXC5_9ACTO|nr:3-oxoacyl-ACP reductase FabG [Buchananella hordeovulneris]MDO5081424.1 3-oxoacyl-ACP reductase FabG [Buchananella hordeovulneris]OKL52274.1 beta-ketoacyl-ACP reductase [Buchananella hordeovulneris]RRD45535.1 SDR family oxidoreductase [Buchananella hordeovulneris]RRD52335.1 SDR family oxidoreductase [Buchananella hordeovulneris]
MTQARSIFVTGASTGIGAAIAAHFLAAGDQVATLSRSGKGPQGALNLAGSVADAGDVEAAFAAAEAAHGPVSVLVANAGITRDTLLMRMSEADWDDVIATNLTGVQRVVRRAITPMIKARHGRIIAISSVVGMLGSPGQVAYAAAKAGLIGLVRSLTREVGGRGITANVVAPGFVDTAMTQVLPDKLKSDYLQRIPAGRFGEVDDIAAAVGFLASPQAGYISGAVLPVDGGVGMGH